MLADGSVHSSGSQQDFWKTDGGQERAASCLPGRGRTESGQGLFWLICTEPAVTMYHNTVLYGSNEAPHSCKGRREAELSVEHFSGL